MCEWRRRILFRKKPYTINYEDEKREENKGISTDDNTRNEDPPQPEEDFDDLEFFSVAEGNTVDNMSIATRDFQKKK